MNPGLFATLLLVAAAVWYWRRVRPRIRKLEAAVFIESSKAERLRQAAELYDAALLQHAAELQWVRDVRAAVGLGVVE